jgi:hypothetical protein
MAGSWAKFGFTKLEGKEIEEEHGKLAAQAQQASQKLCEEKAAAEANERARCGQAAQGAPACKAPHPPQLFHGPLQPPLAPHQLHACLRPDHFLR